MGDPLTVKAFAGMRHAVDQSAGTGHEAAVERAFARHRLHRRVGLDDPPLHGAAGDRRADRLIVTVPRRLAQTFAGFPT